MSSPPATAWRPSALLRASAGLHLLAGAAVATRPDLWPAAALAVVANHIAVTAAYLTPRSRLLGPNIVRLPAVRDANEVALTFDDGPDPEVTPRVLDVLEGRRARATFFCVGSRVARYPDLARDIHARGHRIENHSLHHSNAFAFQGPRRMRAEIEAAQAAVESAVGRRPLFFRAPAGMRNPWVDLVLHRLGLRLVSWTRRGFDTVRRDPARVTARLVRGLAAGDILLLHDGRAARDGRGRPVVLECLPRLLDALEARGLRSVTLDEAIATRE